MLRNLTPITKNIILLNVIVYVITNLLAGGYLYNLLSAYYPFSPNFRSWQIITHMFMHAPFSEGSGITHILFNMITLMSFGPVLEHILEGKKYIILYFFSGFGAFFIFNVWNLYEVHQLTQELQNMGINVSEIFRKSDFNYNQPIKIESISTPQGNVLARELLIALQTPMVGASGAIFGVVAAFSTMFPNAKLFFLFIPFPIKAKYIFPFIIVVSLYLGISGTMSGVAHFAHIGGALVGFILAKQWKNEKFRIL